MLIGPLADEDDARAEDTATDGNDNDGTAELNEVISAAVTTTVTVLTVVCVVTVMRQMELELLGPGRDVGRGAVTGPADMTIVTLVKAGVVAATDTMDVFVRTPGSSVVNPRIVGAADAIDVFVWTPGSNVELSPRVVGIADAMGVLVGTPGSSVELNPRVVGIADAMDVFVGTPGSSVELSPMLVVGVPIKTDVTSTVTVEFSTTVVTAGAGEVNTSGRLVETPGTKLEDMRTPMSVMSGAVVERPGLPAPCKGGRTVLAVPSPGRTAR